MYTWFSYEGFVYGSMLEWEPEYESFTRADSPTVSIQLSTGEMKTVGDFEPAAFKPAGPYLIYANSDDESWTHPLLMNLDGSNPIRLPID